MFWVYVILFSSLFCGSETGDTHVYCHPVDCVDGSCYCTDRNDGWFNGGGFCSKNSRDCGCTCDNAGTSCQNKRCPDEWTQSIIWDGNIYAGTQCYYDDPVKGRIYSEGQWFDFCYRTTAKCDYNKCQYSESLVGCARISAGSCQKCPELGLNKYWASKGSCVQNDCSVALGGKFVAKPCTSTTDAVIANCSGYPGNKGYIVANSRDTYYCPGGGLVLPLPENSQPTADFSAFECIDGYYFSGSSCLACPPGFACKYGKKYTCPVHYYTSAFSMSSCTRCTTPEECSTWEKPMRCEQGSTANPGCVSCSGCSFDPKRGLSCVTETYEMQGLLPVCTPVDVDAAVAVCQSQ